jgi:DNA-binding XRE family transcriptional regulator
MRRISGSAALKKRAASTGKRTTDAMVILDRMMGGDPAVLLLAEVARSNAVVSQLIYDARTKAKLTQKQLAALVGTTQPAIARLEDADYEGYSLAMLNRIAAALERRVEIRLVRTPRVKGLSSSKNVPSLSGSH